MLEQWVSANVDLIKTVPKDSLGSLKEKVYSDYMNGRSTTNIVKELQRQYGMDKRHAQLIARDQTAKLNSNITQSQQRDAGVNKYKWSTVGDGRVRDSHDALDGEIFSWDDPPETDDGRRCHPGEDYQCRCCAIPVFDIDELDLPV
jgi:SPP1 gp7 family putative phage head morphogenesis protein